jgi:predicted TIM-barrel fold metal-dependent hydrolase
MSTNQAERGESMQKWIVGALLFGQLLAGQAVGQEPVTPWRKDPDFHRLATVLDKVPAIDMHTHLLNPGEFDPALADVGPLQLRSTHPWLPTLISQRFGVSAQPNNWPATIKMIDAARSKMVSRLGQTGYWSNHLDFTVTEIALVNQNSRQGIDGKRLLWVPHATTLLYPLPADRLMERSPSHKTDITAVQKDLREFLKEGGSAEVPADLQSYVRFVDATLRRWQQQGAVGIKFWDAYLRTLRIADVPAQQATSLYAKGQSAPLSRDEYLAVQDYLWRHILLEAGKIKLPVHIHSSLGVPPFLRTLESDVRNLEDVLTDAKFFETQIVLIHGGAPWYEIAGYLALKPNVWIDISAIAFLRPVTDVADILRQYLIFAPEKVLFGTDASAYPTVPGGADVHHLLVSRAARDALYVALSRLIRDGVINERQAIEMGRGVIRENARRLHGWK